MTSIRIAIVSALAVAALFAGSANTQHSAPASTSHAIALAGHGKTDGPVLCC